MTQKNGSNKTISIWWWIVVILILLFILYQIWGDHS